MDGRQSFSRRRGEGFQWREVVKAFSTAERQDEECLDFIVGWEGEMRMRGEQQRDRMNDEEAEGRGRPGGSKWEVSSSMSY